MTRSTLALPESLWAELNRWLDSTDEIAGVLTARVIDDAGGTTLLGRQLLRADENAYLEQRPDGLSLRSTAWVPAVRKAHDDGAMAIFVHTHPKGMPVFSRLDDVVDDTLSAPFQNLTGADLYGSLVIAGGARPAARLRRGNGSAEPITAIRVVGDELRIHLLTGGGDALEAHDRQVRALGADGQSVLRQLHVGVVGAGGTGSPVIEQLARLGVGAITVIDDDIVTPSSVARGYGSTRADIGRPKVEVAAANVQRIGLGTEVTPIKDNLRSLAAIKALRHCDVAFCCVDGHAARLVLNRWAYWHLAPVIDIGVLVSSTAGRINGINGRLTWLAPKAACLLCRGRIDGRLAHVEQLDPEERRRLTEQGYAPELPEPEPSIVTYTTLLASIATTELLNRLFRLADPTPTEQIHQLHARTVSLNRRAPREGCFCAEPGDWGRGMDEPYLDLVWAN
jgi:hypothetical protein